MTEQRKLFRGELRMGRDLSRGSQVIVRSLALCMGLAVLLSDSVFSLSDGQIILAAILLGLVLLSSLPNILELLGGSGERGGTFHLIKDVLGNPLGFAGGWSLLAGYAVLASAFIRSASILIFPYLPFPALTLPLLGLGLLLLLSLFELLQFFPRRKWIRPVVFLCAGAGLFTVLSIFPSVDFSRLQAYESSSPNFLQAVALLMLSYSAIEEMLSLRYRIREPERHLWPGIVITALTAVGLFAILPVLVAASPAGNVSILQGGIVEGLAQVVKLPTWVLHSLGILVQLIAADLCLMAAVRQLQALGYAGALPKKVSQTVRPFRRPLGLFILLLFPMTGALLALPLEVTFDAAAGLFLAPVLLVNAAGFYSRQNEPERRRSFLTPFFPIVPITGVILSAVLLLSLLPLAGGLVFLWLAAGFLYYATYARDRMVEAQEGVLVFRREPHRPKAEGAYRILVPMSAGVERRLLVEMASSLAHGLHGEVIPLQVIPVADPLAVEEGQRLAYERNTLFQWSTRDLARPDVITSPITRLARSVPEGILDTAAEEDCDLILLSWSIHAEESGNRLGRVLDPVVRGATCDLAVVAFQSERLRDQAETIAAMENGGVETPGGTTFSLKRILVPTAGGPHAPLAVRLALILAREYDAQVRSVYVTGPNATPEEVTQGRERIATTLECMRREADNLGLEDDGKSGLEAFLAESRVVPAESIVAGIVRAAEESDLLLIGASEESLLDQFMFGNLPEQVARDSQVPVAMVKRYQGLRRFWIQRLWDTLFEAMPTLSTGEQVPIYKEIHRQARPDIDFFIMMGLSALIATFGLLQNSSAVIIGAMLVAPLFTPLLALSMGIVLGNIRLLRLAIEAMVKGIAVAIGVAALITILSPLKLGTPEILARTEPNLFDLGVALASGIAGAYAVARKDVATSLPGVAIAAALVPPLGVIGIGLAMGDMEIAGGATLLFATNLIAIAFSGSITFLLLGFRPTSRREGEARLRVALISSILLLVIISIPLASVFINAAHDSSVRQVLDEELEAYFEGAPAYEMVAFDFTSNQDELDVSITLYAQEGLSETLGMELQQILTDRIGDPVRLELIAIPVIQVEQP